jgi:signal peptidase I
MTNFFNKHWKVTLIFVFIIVSLVSVSGFQYIKNLNTTPAKSQPIYLKTEIFGFNGKSMHPNVVDGDMVCGLNEFVESDLVRGDLLFYTYHNGDLFLQRLIGFPEEIIAFDKGTVGMVKDSKFYPLKEDYLFQEIKTYKKITTPDNYFIQESVIAKDYYYLLGDNRIVAYDSRISGPVQLSKIISQALFKVETSEDQYLCEHLTKDKLFQNYRLRFNIE